MKCLNRKRIKLVNTEGLHSFSLRKVAAACGVSHAAPYSHFQSKEELLDAMQQYITDEFSRILEEAIQGNENTSGLLENMEIAYVSFIYSQSNMCIDLSSSIPDQENFRPFVIYKNIVFKLLREVNYPSEKQSDVVIDLWAFIHGLTSLATMRNVCYENNWKQKIIDFMDIFALSFLKTTEE